MKHRFTYISSVLLLIISMIILQNSCSKKKQEKEFFKIDQGFKEYVSAFTSGVISAQSTIKVRLTSQYKQDVEPGTETGKKLFTFEPSIKGKSFWIDDQTIEFRPEKKLKSGTLYNGSFELARLIETPAKFKTLPMQFQVIKQSFKVQKDNLKPYDQQNLLEYYFEGTLLTADYLENDKIEDIIRAEQSGRQLKITWVHDGENKRHTFRIDSIKRKEDNDIFILSWDGSKQEIDIQGSEEIEVPGMNQFKLMSAKVYHQPDQYVLLTFSDPLQTNQNLDGLIRIKNEKGLSYSIENNQIKVFLKTRIAGSRKITINKGIKNSVGYPLKKTETKELTFEATNPEIRILGKGVIVPSSNGLMFPFESVNLSAVDVKVIRIYENNIAQFLQVNELDGNNQLKRVGRLIIKKKVDLVSDRIIDYGTWNAFSIDISELIETEPGAIYKVELSFKKSYSMYPCSNSGSEEAEQTEEWDEYDEDESSYWDYYDDYYSDGDYYYDDYYYYNWRDRENPCHKAYYQNKKVSRNILASDLGLIAKSGKNGILNVAVSDINTTQPMAGVELEIYNYQQQLVGTAKTDANGIASVSYKMKPFLLIAKKDRQRGYLKLNDGSSLSLSKFDVAGAIVQKGLKGFIYGERGVWRPGDTIFLSFILEDKENLLPDQHPVVFELLNPEGKITKRIVRVSSENNFYNFTTITDSEAPTGNWTAKIRVGGAFFTKVIKIETIKPNRLKININFGKDFLTRRDRDLKGKLSVKWLHGAIAKNLQAQVDVTLLKAPTRFNRYIDYIFDDPASDFEPEEENIFDSRIDENGEASLYADFELGSEAGGMLKARFMTKVFEEGGNFSVDQFDIPYAPYDHFVGIKVPKGDKARGMLLTDKKHTVEVVTVNAQGDPVSVSNLEARVYKVEWRWWWQSGADNLASYIGRSSVSPIVSKKLSTKDGLGSFDFEVKYPDWGRYLIRVSSPGGHSTGKTVYIDWPGWAGRAQRENPGGASMLTFSSDKQKYTVGETAKITIPTSEGGRALISLESGTKVLESHWVETQNEQTNFSFSITEQMAPNVYVNVTLLQPHAQTKNDLPIRLYGVIPLMVDNPNTRLEPEILMADELRPESKTEITVKEKNGKPMTFTLAVVDEGLLDLTRFQTPDPWKTFYAREALSVKTWDIYDMVLGAYGGRIEQIFAIGGGGELESGANRKANRFVPVVRYFGPFTLTRNGKKTINFQMPRYIGSVRTMVVAGDQGKYGSTEKTVPVKSPLMMLATLPRVLGPGEKVKLPVTVFALDERIKNATIQVKSSGPLKVSGESTRKVSFSKPGEMDITFDIDVKQQLGIGKVELIAKSGSEVATYEIEIDVRAPNPPKTKSYSAVLKPGESWKYDFELFGIAGTNEGIFEVSGMPPLNLDKRLRYLLRYPYGCVEQTTSSVFPQLYINEVVDLDKEFKKRIEKNIKAGIERLKGFQLSGGGFGYWPGANSANDWSSSYAGHFLIEAENKGYKLPSGMKSSWISYQKTAANNWVPSPSTKYYYRSDLAQAYRLYTLALAGDPDLGSMNRLREESISIQSKYMLAAAYAVSGNKEAAKDLIRNLERNIEDYRELSYTYGSGDRDRAIILETLLILEMYDEAMPVIKIISDHLNNNYWMSTQTTAYCLKAMAQTAKIFRESADKFEYSYKLNNQAKLDVMSTNLVNQHQLSFKQAQINNTINITNKSKVPFYINLSLTGTPLHDSLETIQKNLKISPIYRDLDGNRINPGSIIQGTDFKLEITVTNPGLIDHYKELALTTIFPSGWEILNTRLYGGGEAHSIDIPTYQDIRDDRVNTFFDLQKGQSKTFVLLLNASYLGEYTMPAINCSAMYNNDIRARTPGKKVYVIQPGSD